MVRVPGSGRKYLERIAVQKSQMRKKLPGAGRDAVFHASMCGGVDVECLRLHEQKRAHGRHDFCLGNKGNVRVARIAHQVVPAGTCLQERLNIFPAPCTGGITI